MSRPTSGEARRSPCHQLAEGPSRVSLPHPGTRWSKWKLRVKCNRMSEQCRCPIKSELQVNDELSQHNTSHVVSGTHLH